MIFVSRSGRLPEYEYSGYSWFTTRSWPGEGSKYAQPPTRSKQDSVHQKKNPMDSSHINERIYRGSLSGARILYVEAWMGNR